MMRPPLARYVGQHRTVALLAASMIVLAALVIPMAETSGSAASGATTEAPADCTAPPQTSTSGASFTATETLCRVFFDAGVTNTNHFSVTVSNTTGLRNDQVVTVNWSGAHPTGGIISDEQQVAAAQQEYPVVLMECRGTPSQVSPETCWTASSAERTPSTSEEPMWSLDTYNSAAHQQLNVNIPSPIPATCNGVVGSGRAYWLPFIAADGTHYGVGPKGCLGAPPEMWTGSGNELNVPSDTTYAETSLDGTGTDKFTIETSEANASLGCSQTVACSLVIIPIEGISCNANPTVVGSPQYTCENEGDFPAGSLNIGDSGVPAQAVTGTYWWSASNWQRRVSVPLGFTTPADACQQNSSTPLEFNGSELMVQATQQWNPYFCLNSKLFNVNQVQLPEPQAKTSLQQGDIEAAIQGEPPSVPSGQKSSSPPRPCRPLSGWPVLPSCMSSTTAMERNTRSSSWILDCWRSS